MRRLNILSVTVGSFILGCLALPNVSAAETQKTEDEIKEPAQEYIVEVDGKSMPLELDKAVEIEKEGKKVSLTVHAKPQKLFKRASLEFQYPSYFAYEGKGPDDGVVIHTLSGRSTVVIVSKYAIKGDAQTFAAATVNLMVSMYKAENVIKEACVVVTKNGEVKGTRLNVSLAGQLLVQEIYPLVVEGAPYTLVLQDSPGGKGKETPEFANLKDLLKKTCSWSEERK